MVLDEPIYTESGLDITPVDIGYNDGIMLPFFAFGDDEDEDEIDDDFDDMEDDFDDDFDDDDFDDDDGDFDDDDDDFDYEEDVDYDDFDE